MDEHTRRRIQRAGAALFALYLIVLVYLLFFAEDFGRGTDAKYSCNLVPFREIGRFWRYAGVVGWKASLINIGGNVAAFVPFGALLPLFGRKWRGFFKITGLTALFSATVEITQLLTRTGICDVDDVILNTLGGALGYALFAACNGIRRKLSRN